MYVQELSDKIANDSSLKQRMSEDPEGTIKSIAAGAPPLQTDVTIYRMVVGSLGLALISGMIGAIILAFFDKEIPAEATALGSAAVGALAGLLAPSPRQQ